MCRIELYRQKFLRKKRVISSANSTSFWAIERHFSPSSSTIENVEFSIDSVHLEFFPSRRFWFNEFFSKNEKRFNFQSSRWVFLEWQWRTKSTKIESVEKWLSLRFFLVLWFLETFSFPLTFVFFLFLCKTKLVDASFLPDNDKMQRSLEKCFFFFSLSILFRFNESIELLTFHDENYVIAFFDHLTECYSNDVSTFLTWLVLQADEGDHLGFIKFIPNSSANDLE